MTKRQPDNSEFRTHPGADPSSNDVTLEGSAFSRRDFIAEAGRLGLLMYATPRLGDLLVRTEGGVWGRTTPPAPAQQVAALAPGLKWRMLGPFRGGRTDAVCGVHGRPNEFYFGAVNGGVWKTVDAGRVWEPVFDGQPVASIGALAVAPSAPDTVYVGSGESTLRDSTGFGNGMYKSTDAGKTWTHIGLDDTQHIGRVAVHPRNPNIVFVAAIGHLYAASPERGVFRTTDGGKTWKKVLFKDDNVGAVEVVIDPVNPQVVYAGLWNTRRPPWYTYAPTNGPGGGIFKSTDGGNTWKPLTNGLPKEGIGKSGIAIAPSNPRRVYLVVDCLVPDPNAPPPAAGGGGRGAAAIPRVRSHRRRRGREVSSDPTTRARRGPSCRTIRRSGDEGGTSSTSSSIPRTPTMSTCRTSPYPDPRTAATHGSRCAGLQAATTITNHGSRPTTRTR